MNSIKIEFYVNGRQIDEYYPGTTQIFKLAKRVNYLRGRENTVGENYLICRTGQRHPRVIYNLRQILSLGYINMDRDKIDIKKEMKLSRKLGLVLSLSDPYIIDEFNKSCINYNLCLYAIPFNYCDEIDNIVHYFKNPRASDFAKMLLDELNWDKRKSLINKVETLQFNDYVSNNINKDLIFDFVDYIDACKLEFKTALNYDKLQSPSFYDRHYCLNDYIKYFLEMYTFYLMLSNNENFVTEDNKTDIQKIIYNIFVMPPVVIKKYLEKQIKSILNIAIEEHKLSVTSDMIIDFFCKMDFLNLSMRYTSKFYLKFYKIIERHLDIFFSIVVALENSLLYQYELLCLDWLFFNEFDHYGYNKIKNVLIRLYKCYKFDVTRISATYGVMELLLNDFNLSQGKLTKPAINKKTC